LTFRLKRSEPSLTGSWQAQVSFTQIAWLAFYASRLKRPNHTR
jgi:hypothetical protein